jgi:hypothetical protein
MHKPKTLTFTTTSKNTYTIDLSLEISIDTAYGADADGNRGIYREFIDEVDIISIQPTVACVADNEEIDAYIENRFGVIVS